MTNPTTATPTTDTTEEQTAAETPDAEATSDETTTTDPAVNKARKDAAGYRQRLRDTEGERDTANATIDTLRHQMIDGQVESLGIKPAAFWAAGTTMADLLSDDGGVDSDLVAEAATAARDTLGLPRFSGTADGGRGKSFTPAASGPENWGSLLKTR